MGIQFNLEQKIFKLDTPHTTYLVGIVDQEGFIGHGYYGKRLVDGDYGDLMRINEPPFVPSVNNRDRGSFLDTFPMEYPGGGLGDFRESCIEVISAEGHKGCGLTYVSHEIVKGKPNLKGLPATFGREEEVTTLNIHCEDKNLGLEVTLVYSVFEKLDVICRNAVIKNASDKVLTLDKAYSVCLDMDNKDFDLMTLHGTWARERSIQRKKIGYGKQSASSIRGESSHQDHPFMALANGHTTQTQGEVYGFHFVYSGNFVVQAELTQFDTVRAVVGIHQEGFRWKLEPGSDFTTPEVVMVYAFEGLGQMSRTYHDLYRNHLIRGSYKDKKRPILINNWEATYFDFDTDKILAIAKEAASVGIEMLVLDDGWFGNRSDDNSALGDWFVNENKLKGGLKNMVDQINAMGLKFGLWFEPEMVSPDSDLYRAHPDWAIQIPNRKGTLCRNQLVLDLTRQEVRDEVYKRVSDVVKSANIEYIKWDMNRQLTDVGSYYLAADCQGELYHRYVLGVYELQERLITDFPSLLLENCSGGGARFDPGMLYFSPQIWTSDNTDAIDRLAIQEGTALIYPLSAMGAHVSDCPNHTVGRVTPFETRGFVALAGTFGYELDVTKIPKEDRDMIPEQVAMYHQYNDLVREGDYYRLASYRVNHQYDCWQVVSKDKREALVTYIQVLNRPNVHSRRIYLQGLDPEANYQIGGTDKIMSGGVLMYGGLNAPRLWGDFKGKLIHLIRA